MNMRSSVLLSVLAVCLKSRPRSGMFWRPGMPVRVVLLGRLIDPAEHHGLPFPHKQLGNGLPLRDGRHGKARVEIRLVLLCLDRQPDIPVLYEMGGHLKLQHGELEHDVGAKLCRGALVGDLRALCDPGRVVFGGDDLRAGYDLAPALGLESGKHQVELQRIVKPPTNTPIDPPCPAPIVAGRFTL